MIESGELSAVFLKIADLALALGVKALSKRPGCWEYTVDEQWWVAVNGHAEPTPTSEGDSVPAFCAYLKFNGWPAGFIDPYGGLMAAGELANEDTLLAALDGAIQLVSSGMSEPVSLTERRQRHLDAELAKLSAEERTRFETLRVASTKCREIAHGMLDAQLDVILPELLAAIDAGRTFAVLVVDPERMPIIPESPRLTIVGPNGKPPTP